jgi:shikimate dehydrogenase
MFELAPDLVTVVDPTSEAVGAAVTSADVVVNTTAVGMAGGPDPDGVPVPVEALEARHLVVDIVYQPRVTPLLAAARACGANTANGLGMLVGQAAEQFTRWTGQSAPYDVMLQAAAT